MSVNDLKKSEGCQANDANFNEASQALLPGSFLRRVNKIPSKLHYSAYDYRLFSEDSVNKETVVSVFRKDTCELDTAQWIQFSKSPLHPAFHFFQSLQNAPIANIYHNHPLYRQTLLHFIKILLLLATREPLPMFKVKWRSSTTSAKKPFSDEKTMKPRLGELWLDGKKPKEKLKD